MSIIAQRNNQRRSDQRFARLEIVMASARLYSVLSSGSTEPVIGWRTVQQRRSTQTIKAPHHPRFRASDRLSRRATITLWSHSNTLTLGEQAGKPWTSRYSLPSPARPASQVPGNPSDIFCLGKACTEDRTPETQNTVDNGKRGPTSCVLSTEYGVH